MKRSLICLLAIALILAGTAKADGGAALTQCINPATSDDTGAIALAFIALTFSFDVIAIGYILSKIFPGSGIKEWIATEYWEVAKTAMLIVGVYAALALLGNMASLIAPSAIVSTSGGSAITVTSTSADFTGLTSLANGACSYLNYEATFAGVSVNYFTGVSESIGAFGSLNLKWQTYLPIDLVPPIVLAGGFNMLPYQNNMLQASPIASTYQSIINDMWTLIILPVTVAIEGQVTLIPILFAVGLGALIPIGLVLRAFPFVRGVGGTFIAIGIGLSLVYPSTLVLLNYPVTIALQGSAIPVPSQVGSGCSGPWEICGIGSAFFTQMDSAGASAPGGLGNVPGDYFGTLQGIFPTLNGTLYYGTYMLLQLFLFILDLAITITLVDNMTNMLGGKLITSIGKLRLG